MKQLREQLRPEGDFWNRALDKGGKWWPEFLEPILIPIYSLLFFFSIGTQRRAVVANYAVLFPKRSWLRRNLMTLRMFTSFSFSIVEAVRCRTLRSIDDGDPIDWEFEGLENFEKLAREERGSIMLTAHMGNYDIAAGMYAQFFDRRLNTVRAPERNAEVQARREAMMEAEFSDSLRVHFNTTESMLGLELTRALHAGEFVAIQGDRVVSEVSEIVAPFSDDWWMRLPKGPFVLSQMSGSGVRGTEIYPLFVIRRGWRRYRILVFPSFYCERTAAADREAAVARAAEQWVSVLKPILRNHWRHWYVFEEVFRNQK